MKNISFRYGTKTILNGFDLTIEKGKTYCLVGSSGSGKTTTLRLINGLLRPSSGQIKIDGKDFDFSQAEKWRRSMGYSIQGSGLFPHMTVYENLSIIARKEGMSDQQIQSRISELCELVNLPADSTFLNKRPRQISGGQQQRVGIARALFMEPDVMLMDEPFSALDPITRSELQKEFVSLKQKLDMTVILVTHDLPEAFQMADEIVLLNSGRIEQKGRPSQFLLKPTSNFVKEFIRSHSPGNLLKQVYLYSVVNNQLFTAIRKSNSITLTNLDNGQSFNFLNVDEVYSYLQKFDQTAIYWTDEMGQFLHFEHQRSEPCFDHLISTDHILNGMKKILDSGLTTLPVVSERGQLIGVFSREALDAL